MFCLKRHLQRMTSSSDPLRPRDPLVVVAVRQRAAFESVLASLHAEMAAKALLVEPPLEP